ncbi:hypothetical protein CFE70_009402 [Pyrenophora teres f. teres 0-1]|uniref:Uncharacterized protein n=2 Tax=Pyrenophora teres f. teres TaxID=97479 RepID=E3RZ54_PYRTT|nr:hypothetical protein PTT_14906 [Pyrenophora teres f. teres 0-1]KAE8827314.1 hypothetical protein PTNB85_08667 [Pyrenophora teres f. teres]KAE8855168.1 hypothetical protein PTNB29_09419 [Pyrenophora teres f. teres]CAA9966010.1 hypothetical protein PTMSG1_09369 [Pyrenophora teres f. maculata]CAE7211203.1 hypothetical protein PTTW11_10139 [Pyrenophora teres f. teres]
MAVGLGETITVINKSGKVVSSSKHVFNVFKEAKAAYRERKAEIKAERDAQVKERELAKGVKAIRIDDDARSHVSHRSRKSHHAKSQSGRPAIERGYSANDAQNMEIARRSSEHQVQKARSKSEANIDMDLAYGDVPPPLPDNKYDDLELQEKASKIELLLDEANCLQHTATAMIENLQKNPEALAAVSLTLAELSAIVGKMGPGVLMTLKGSFPAVAALLLSPQFMIAGGVAVGVTIVALGGYKIIKKIQAQNDAPPPQPMLARAATAPVSAPAPVAAIEDTNCELDELQPQELSRVEMWRRGIADVEANSAGTSVDGEFITPGASRQLCDAGVLDEDDLKSRRSTRSRRTTHSESKHKSHRTKSEKTSKTTKTSESKRPSSKAPSKAPSVAPSKTSSRSGKESSRKKEKEPSGLKMLFRAHTVAV